MRLPHHPIDHAHKRAREHHWQSGLGPRVLPRDSTLPALEPGFFPRCRGAAP